MGGNSSKTENNYINYNFSTDDVRQPVQQTRGKLFNRSYFYSRNYFMYNYAAEDRIINETIENIEDIYPQTKKNFINIIKKAKKEKQNFYLKYEINGFYGDKKAWWIYKGKIQIDIEKYKNYKRVLCFPFEAKKELCLAEERKFNSQFPDGYDNFVNTIRKCEKNNIPFVIVDKWNPNIFTVYKLE